MNPLITRPAQHLARAAALRLSADSRIGRLLRSVYRRLTPQLARPRYPAVIDAFAKSRSDVFFVQVGSNDAGWGDPIRHHVLECRWSGIVIEPQPEVFPRLQARYAALPGVRAECLAIAPTDGRRPFYYLAPSDESGLPPWYDQLGSFDREHLVRHREFLPDIEQRIRSREVECMRLDTLLDKHAVQRVDLLHIDAEGFDLEILKLIPFERIRPELILFEHRHLGAQGQQAAERLLTAQGYRLYRDRHDTLALHETALGDPAAPVAKAWAALPDTPRVHETAL